MSVFTILSLDGGGIRGVVSASMLERLEQAHPGFLSQVDLFAGSSTGGLLALGLASGKIPTEALQLYEQHGPDVFSDTFIDDFLDFGTMIGADYQIEPLREVLLFYFGDLTLDDLPGKVLISSFDLDSGSNSSQRRTWKAKFFHNFPGSDSDGRERVVDVAIRTCVAPTYFPIYQGYIDGGVVANNPSICALSQALNPIFGNRSLDDIRLISIGTGHNPMYLASQDGDWGLIAWAPYIINLMLEGSVDLVDYQCRQILCDRYLRINPLLSEPIGIDRVDRIPTLKRIARQYDLTDASRWIEQNYG